MNNNIEPAGSNRHDLSQIPVVILCGGRGTRLREQTEFIPKPLVEIGGKPILWHIMKVYQSFGFKRFILCLGYKGDMIKKYFLDYEYLNNDFTMKLGPSGKSVSVYNNDDEDIEITFADTGLETHTGGRIKAIEKYIDTDLFMVTYGDGVGDVDLQKLLEFHRSKGKIATLTGVKTPSKYGTIVADRNDTIFSFAEKPVTHDRINAGFFVFNRQVFDFLDDTPMESTALVELSKQRQLVVFNHDGYWQCMDTHKDYLDLNSTWQQSAPWKMWK